MKLAISNIAWPAAEDAAVAELLDEFGVTAVEVAPTRVWPEPLDAPDSELVAFRARWADRGISICSLQALLFGRPELALFATEETRAATLAHLRGMARLGGLLGAGPLVFGAPSNRRRAELEPARAMDIAERFFRAAGEAAAEHGTQLCIEPNPPAYGCDFVTNAQEGLELVRRVAHPGFGLHLDAAALTLAGEDVERSVLMCRTELCHFHASEARLAPLSEPLESERGVDHVAMARALRAAGYRGVVALEMRETESRPAIHQVRRALRALTAYYG